jgi:hypothetical protein
MALGSSELSDLAGLEKVAVMLTALEATVSGFERHDSLKFVHIQGRRST